jgi:Protein of unknown function (DUF3618)
MGQTTEELNTDIEGTRQSLAEDLDALQDKVSPSAVMQRRKDAIASRVRGMGSRIMGSTSSAGRGVTNVSSGVEGGVRGAASDVAGSAEGRVEGNPLTAGLVAFGVGVVVGARLLPATDAESRASRTVVETAKEHGAPVADATKSAAHDMVDGLREPASSAAQEVKSSAQESAARVQDQASGSAQHVRSEAT